MGKHRGARRARNAKKAGGSAGNEIGEGAVAAAPQPIVIHPPLHGVTPDETPVAAPAPLGALSGTATLEGPVSADRPAPGAPSPAPPELATEKPRRAFSLDALRGLLLLMMTLGFTIRGTFFPDWMYHRQQPPPTYEIASIAGISWRDIAYVAFLFTMAAALPLTLSRLSEKGVTELGVLFTAVRRFFLLLVFALLIGHSNTFFTGYTQTTRALAIAGFVVMMLVFTRRREDWSPGVFRTATLLGWAAAIALLALSPLLYGETFNFNRIDDIISGIAFAALVGSVVWYTTRDNLPARLGLLGVVVALYLGSRGEGWIQTWWWSSPIPWAISPSRLTLLCIVIPGTIAGDAILRWTRAGADDVQAAGIGQRSPWNTPRMLGLALLAFAFAPVVVAGMYNRAVLLTTQLAMGMVVGGLFLTWGPVTAVERMLRSLFLWGAIWLMLGLFLEPFEGGIRKVPETLSYFFTVTGITVMLLVSLTAVIDGLRGTSLVRPLIDVGHNPMLCYVLFTVLINPALEMIEPMRTVLRGSPGEQLLRSGVETLAVLLIVMAVTRRKIYWRT